MSDFQETIYKEENREYSVCPRCGGKFVIQYFLTANGEDDTDWDFLAYCEECDNAEPEDIKEVREEFDGVSLSDIQTL